MEFLTKKHLSRRTVLRGMGVTMALPVLEAMSPALTARAGEVRYSHEERLSGLSDHSALILDL